MIALTEGQMTALLNLSSKSAGEEVDWICIADARALTDMGLAERDAGGWHISPAGRERLAAGEAPRDPPRDRRPERKAPSE